MDPAAAVLAASSRIAPYVRRTPLEPSPWLSRVCDAEVFLKLENQQHTGSFKFRGAMNRLLVMDPDRRQAGIVAASTGNHGAGVARGAAVLRCPAKIFAPRSAIPGKLAAIRAHGATVELAGQDCVEAETAARAYAREHGLDYISPYNDPEVLAGQGSIAVEILEEQPDLDVVFVAVGGGGLIGGIGSYLAVQSRPIQVVGASPRNSAVMHASLEAGRILDLESLPTLSDGTAGGIEADSLTFPICQRVVDRFELVEEEAIAAALRDVLTHHHQLIEGAAAVAVAACLAQASTLSDRRVAVVLCGANIDLDTLRTVLGPATASGPS